MADFVAVIRRTVDGLSDNVPEMRAKVYDKARSAVRRQLENMTPRPSEDMIERQMLKLETAIQEVEEDHAVALPQDDEPAIQEEQRSEEVPALSPDVVPEPIAEPPEEQPSPVPEPVAYADEPQPEPVAAEPVSDPAPYAEEEQTIASGQEYADSEAPEPPVAPEPEYVPVPDHTAEPEAPEAWTQDTVEPAPVYEPEPASEPVPVSEFVPPIEVVSRAPEPVAAPAEPDPVPDMVEAHPAAETPVEPFSVGHPQEHFTPPSEPFFDPQPRYEPETVAAEPAAPTEWELPEWNKTAPVAATEPAAAAVTAHVEAVRHEPVDHLEMGSDVPDLLRDHGTSATGNADPWVQAETNAAVPQRTDQSHNWDLEDKDPFAVHEPAAVQSTEPAIADWSWPVEKPVDESAGSAGGATSNWDEVDTLLNDSGLATGAAVARDGSFKSGDVPQARPVSYRVEPKRSRFPVKTALLTVILALLAGGGGYAYWKNQEPVNEWVSGMVASVTSSGPPSSTQPVSNNGSATQTSTPSSDATAVATASSTKFTQRLQPDGTELDSGPAPAATSEVSAEEGKSVAPQTEASKPVQTAQAPAQPAPAETPATTAPMPATTPAPVETPAAVPAAAQIPAGAQKMFLYEERLGQSAPTAIEGTVVWSVKDEAPEAGQKPEPVINAQINVPDRGLTALMTIKRNTDSSLPASHVIEFVFSLPANFEGGSIDSVQRVAMKRTEQDRGDALIAVPAKITEDFHMIALNDFPEAVTTNTELLRTRAWIDIPLTYRNGRRALLTMEKGTAGTEAFTKALQGWSNAPATVNP